MEDKILTGSMRDVLRRIDVMNEKELSETVRSVMERYRTLFPNEEIIFLSLPTDDLTERSRILDHVFRMEEKVSG